MAKKAARKAVKGAAGKAAAPAAAEGPALEGMAKGQFGHGQTQYQGKADPARWPLTERVETEGEEPLKTMRYVLKNHKSHDRTPEEKAYRKLYENDTDKFLARMERLTVQAGGGATGAGSQERPPSPPPAAVDAGSVRCKALSVEWLKKHGVQVPT